MTQPSEILVDNEIIVKIQAVVIGASAGGVDALLKLLSGLPERFCLPIINVLHMPDNRKSKLIEIFQSRSALPVREAADKAAIEPGVV